MNDHSVPDRHWDAVRNCEPSEWCQSHWNTRHVHCRRGNVHPWVRHAESTNRRRNVWEHSPPSPESLVEDKIWHWTGNLSIFIFICIWLPVGSPQGMLFSSLRDHSSYMTRQQSAFHFRRKKREMWRKIVDFWVEKKKRSRVTWMPFLISNRPALPISNLSLLVLPSHSYLPLAVSVYYSLTCLSSSRFSMRHWQETFECCCGRRKHISVA